MKLGIDLGTTKSAMAIYDEEEEGVEVLENGQGEETTPSVVYVDPDAEEGNQVTVGDTARRQRRINTDKVLARTKQHMDTGEEWTKEIAGQDYTPQRTAAYILGHLIEQAEERKQKPVTGAVITVPYDFGATGRRATSEAAEAAGGDDFTVHQVVNEPSAASLAYVHEQGRKGTILVYDLGGGTFDATLAEASEALIKVITTEGDRQLGGEDLDDDLYELVRQKIQDKGGPDPDDALNERQKASLREEINGAKETLSDLRETMVVYEAEGEAWEITLERDELEQAIEEKIDQTIERTESLFEKEAVKEEGIEPDDVDHVLLAGGSTRIPLVQERLEEFFGFPPSQEINQDEAIARGAALKAAQFMDLDQGQVPTTAIQNVLSHTVGLEDNSNKFNLFLEADEKVPVDETQGPYTNPMANPKHLEIPVWEKAEEGQDLGDLDENPEDSDAPERIGGLTFEDIGSVEAQEMRIDVTFSALPDSELRVSAEETEVLNRTIETTIEGLGLSKEEIEGISEDVSMEFTGIQQEDENEEEEGDDESGDKVSKQDDEDDEN
jgi:molecular chaperone DnaK